MVQIYVKYGTDFYLLDLEGKESINLKTTVRELNDITKIFAPFTQSFKIPLTHKNKRIIEFFGNEKILRNGNEFEAKIYISGFLFQTGILTVKEVAKEYSGNFASNATGLSDLIGDATVQDAFKPFDDQTQIRWDLQTLKDSLQTIKNITLTNGIILKYGIPFISNSRTWVYDENNLSIVDNIKHNQNRNSNQENFIKLSEVRPAVNLMAIMEHVILFYKLKVVCPIFSELNDLMVFCNAENLITQDSKAIAIENYNSFSVNRYETKDDFGNIDLPDNSEVRWLTTLNQTTGFWKVKRNLNSYPNVSNWFNGFDVDIQFNNLISLEGGNPKVRINVTDATTGIIYGSALIENSNLNTVYRFQDIPIYGRGFFNPPITGYNSQLDSNGEVYFKIEILPENLVSWSSFSIRTNQDFRYDRSGAFGSSRVLRAKFESKATNTQSSENYGGDKINLITTLPKIKTIDFLKSFFKTFNILIVNSGLEDGTMYWLTPNDIKAYNQPYSSRIETYDNGVLTNKKVANEYNQYLFSHKKSKYYDAEYGNGTRFGSLIYPLTPPKNPTKFEVATEFSIIKQNNFFKHPYAKTCLAFEKEGATVEPNGSNRYKPVFEEFTLFYLIRKELKGASLGSEATNTSNFKIDSILEPDFHNNGKSLAFGAEDIITNSLYLNYYKEFIERLLNPNCYQSDFEVVLKPNEIFINFSNQIQGQSNIPTGFRPQNEIIIGEQIYTLVDSTIDLTTGKAKLKLINNG